jgi:hypothetical protein
MFGLLALPAGAPAQAQAPDPIVLGTARSDDNYVGRLLNRIFTEAFRRLDVPLEIRVFPTSRLSVMAENGEIDGELVRARAYGDAYPNLVRVEAPVVDIVFALWAARPDVQLTRLADLPGSGLSANYARGVLGCENALKPLLPPERLAIANNTEQALAMLLEQRVDLHCNLDFTVLPLAAGAAFRDRLKLHKVLELGEPTALYPYLHRRHAALAPRLAATLRQMREAGDIERLRRQAMKEFDLQ